MATEISIDQLAERIPAGNRRALARGITLLESQRPDHERLGQALLARLLPGTGAAVRLGLSGTPGVGKSTFIEALGLWLTGQGKRVAVLAIDPSSLRTGGSLLGDKTRMERLSHEPLAFIRPSPSGGTLGGVARRTREAMLLCEAAGYDVVIVETVGVGQSEAEVANMVDSFALLLHPGGGDELQGVKRGVLELCDVLCVNKADGELLAAAKQTRLDYERGLRLLRKGESIPVLLASAHRAEGIEPFWRAVESHRDTQLASGAFAERRAVQAERWMWAVVEDVLMHRFRQHDAVGAALPTAVDQVRSGQQVPTQAALALLDLFLNG